jgi:DNA repair protein RadC
MEISNAMIVAEIKLSYHPKVRSSDRPKVNRSQDSYRVLLETWDQGKIDFIEQVRVLLLNKGNRVLGIYEAGSGGLINCLVDMRLMFVAALNSGATSIIISHNHPSGGLKPSREDERLTKNVKLAGEILDIKLLDHIIVTSEGYFSFADDRLL